MESEKLMPCALCGKMIPVADDPLCADCYVEAEREYAQEVEDFHNRMFEADRRGEL